MTFSSLIIFMWWGGGKVGDGSHEMAVGYIEMATEVVMVKPTMIVKLV